MVFRASSCIFSCGFVLLCSPQPFPSNPNPIPWIFLWINKELWLGGNLGSFLPQSLQIPDLLLFPWTCAGLHLLLPPDSHFFFFFWATPSFPIFLGGAAPSFPIFLGGNSQFSHFFWAALSFPVFGELPDSHFFWETSRFLYFGNSQPQLCPVRKLC